jgi:hypothetical protein
MSLEKEPDHRFDGRFVVIHYVLSRSTPKMVRDVVSESPHR